MSRPFPPGRVGLAQLLVDAGISKNTFHLRYRNDPEYIVLLDIEEDRDHRLHFPADAGHRLRARRGKAPHGNRGRTPGRPCPECGHTLHPRHHACTRCWHVLVTAGEDGAPMVARRSTSQVNFERRELLRRAKAHVAHV